MSGDLRGATDAAIRVYVNERPVTVPAGADARAAVRAFDSALADRLDAGTAHLTDGRAVALDPATALAPGAIVRVVVPARRGTGAADATDAAGGEAGDGQD